MRLILVWNICIAVALGCSVERSAKAEVTYVAAVIEFESYNQWTDAEKGYGVIRQNAQAIKDYAVQAKSQSADILITPEYGLQSLSMHEEDPAKFITYTQYVPDPVDNIVPYSMDPNITNFEGMQILSRTAMENSMYLVIGLGELYPCSEETVLLAPWPVQPVANCSASGYFFYNTQVVFDRTGQVIARYRKQNLYGEEYYTPGPKNDTTALFLTDFDVLFTLQICFDIEFEHPAYNNVKTLGIKDVAMSTAWTDSLPFDLADNSFNGWSVGLGVNLIESGYHKPEKSKLGSGIYKGYSKDYPVYVYDKESGNVLLVSQVTTLSASKNLLHDSTEQKIQFGNQKSKPTSNILNDSRPTFTPKANAPPGKRIQYITHSDLSNYTRVILEKNQPGQVFNVNACSYNQYCCDLSYEYSGNLTYMFLVFSGQFLTDENNPIGIQICSVVWCKTEDYQTCALVEAGLPDNDNFGPFTLFSSSFAMDSINPGGNHRDLSLISKDSLHFNVSDKNYTLSSTKPIVNHLMAALYGKWYSNNG